MVTVTVDGLTGCPFFADAMRRWQAVAASHPEVEVVRTDRGPRDAFKAWAAERSQVRGRGTL
jgi:hypothetical protein